MKSFLSEMVANNTGVFSVSGKIRAGTKTLTRKASENPTASALYKRVLNGELSFQSAQAEISKSVNIANPFFPRNTQCFHAHPWDMESGYVASDKLLSLYGEIRQGDQQPRLYRFPVVFPDVHRGGIDVALGSGLAVRGGNAKTVHYQSRYGDDGVRRCVYLPPVVPTREAGRKQFARREFVIRGLCETAHCSEYASGACRFAGTLRFYIPEMPGAGVFSLETGSTHAASEIYLRLASLLQECGTLPNFTSDGRPVFWLTKAKKQRVYYDENGQQKKGDQWVPVLETEIDLAKVKLMQERRRTLSATPSAAPAVAMPSAWFASKENDVDSNDPDHAAFTPVDEAKASPAPTVIVLETENQVAQSVPSTALDDLLARTRHLGLDRKILAWAELRYGPDWEQPAISSKVYEFFAAIEFRFGIHIGAYLDLQNRLLQHNIPFQEVALPYIKQKFGGIGQGEQLSAIVSHLDELLEQGPTVTRSLMESSIRTAT